MDRDTEKAHVTYDPKEVDSKELIAAIIADIKRQTNETPVVLDEEAEGNTIVLLIPDCTASIITEIRGVLSVSSIGTL